MLRAKAFWFSRGSPSCVFGFYSIAKARRSGRSFVNIIVVVIVTGAVKKKTSKDPSDADPDVFRYKEAGYQVYRMTPKVSEGWRYKPLCHTGIQFARGDAMWCS